MVRRIGSKCPSPRNAPVFLVLVSLVLLAEKVWYSEMQCYAFQNNHNLHRPRPFFLLLESIDDESVDLREPALVFDKDSSYAKVDLRRRDFFISVAAAATLLPMVAHALEKEKSLEDVQLGHGQWTKLEGGMSGRSRKSESWSSSKSVVPPPFATYVARILINYDDGVSSWWNNLLTSYSLLSDDQRNKRLGRAFGSLAASIQLAIDSFVQDSPTAKEGYEKFLNRLSQSYSQPNNDVQRHIALLCGILPPNKQPTELIKRIARSNPSSPSVVSSSVSHEFEPDSLSSLLDEKFGSYLSSDGKSCSIQPPINLYEVGVGEEFGPSAIATPFGPLASQVLTRDLPNYSFDIYALFGISGATGCALTHAVVIPLDVVKTKAQTNPEEYADVIAGASRIVREEGFQGLLTGAQATLAGYFWYGLSVYPSYTFFKRLVGQTLLPPDFSIAHSNDIALIAGALAAVIASLGLTPLEAARIRVVADPERYRSLGIVGTLGVIASEDPQAGWKAAYAGLPCLMTRQVIFGSVKFLAFERACESIFTTWPFLRDATWTALMVSLVAGGVSGSLSCVVSQPADAVLTYVAQKNGGNGSLGLLKGCQLLVEESGVSALFRGLGSRCLWAGSIIAGQFLLYDVFRTFFGVNGEDLSQIYQIRI